MENLAELLKGPLKDAAGFGVLREQTNSIRAEPVKNLTLRTSLTTLKFSSDIIRILVGFPGNLMIIQRLRALAYEALPTVSSTPGDSPLLSPLLNITPHILRTHSLTL